MGEFVGGTQKWTLWGKGLLKGTPLSLRALVEWYPRNALPPPRLRQMTKKMRKVMKRKRKKKRRRMKRRSQILKKRI